MVARDVAAFHVVAGNLARVLRRVESVLETAGEGPEGKGKEEGRRQNREEGAGVVKS